MAKNCRVDTSGWRNKSRRVLATEARVVEQVVSFGLDKIFDKTKDNVTGERYGTETRTSKTGNEYVVFKRGPMTNAGKLPVPVVFGNLRRSIKTIRFNTVLGAVYSDPNIAPYNKIIHEGGQSQFFGHKFYMKPRPYLQNAVDTKRPMIKAYAKIEIAKAIRTVGRT